MDSVLPCCLRVHRNGSHPRPGVARTSQSTRLSGDRGRFGSAFACRVVFAVVPLSNRSNGRLHVGTSASSDPDLRMLSPGRCADAVPAATPQRTASTNSSFLSIAHVNAAASASPAPIGHNGVDARRNDFDQFLRGPADGAATAERKHNAIVLPCHGCAPLHPPGEFG